ncbi:MAG: UPF0182 family protein [Pyrinomonadaceae bacterium]
MNDHLRDVSDDTVIEIGSPPRRRWRFALLLLLIPIAIFLLNRFVEVYVESLWFGSLGFSSVFWYRLRLQVLLWVVFALVTFLMLRGGFWWLERSFGASTLQPRRVVVNNVPVMITPGRFLRPLAWVVSLIAAGIAGFDLSAEWQQFALYFHQSPTTQIDPIFGKGLGFYLFTLPVYQTVLDWLMALAVVGLIAAVGYVLLSLPSTPGDKPAANAANRATRFTAISIAAAAVFLVLAGKIYLARFPYLWKDHDSFSGVTYTEAHYFLPALLIISIAMIVSASMLVLNAFKWRGVRLIALACALPIAIFIVGGVIIPSYITNFVVKPNELDREAPFIQHNIEGTRRAFGLEKVESRQYPAELPISSLDLTTNRTPMDNVRLWDWRALKAALHQLQQIRTYYDFPDVDIDRYQINGQLRQVMIAARELNVENLPANSRNWVNEKLIYTHGYGVTMNTANGFTPEGTPLLILSNMPVQSTEPSIQVKRPEIYFGQSTNNDVYVRTKQKEFDYPQGEANTTTTYEGNGGVALGGWFRRMALAWELNDLSKLPFSDAITADSRALMRRNIIERVKYVAPFLELDPDPYIIVTDDGRLVWMIDAFTSAQTVPYSRHYLLGDERVNYLRNSVKVTVDAYDGAVKFYVFDPADPLISSYRAIFPDLFLDASAMPADLRRHVRYPDTLIRTQGEVYGLYHTENPKVFFQREDMWTFAHQVALNRDEKQEEQTLDPYFVLMALPGEKPENEFVQIVPFTPANRNNMIGWMAGRSDGAAYGSLLVYNFPTDRVVVGPMQFEAQIDQDPQLSGQLTLWNQQGSTVLRGNLLVLPIGKGLLYIKPIYLKAARSPMPELRLVVLATQEKLVYGSTFAEALTKLLGEPATAPIGPDAKPTPTPVDNKGKPVPPPPTPPTANTKQLIDRATQEFNDYQRLTQEGKFGEAGLKLEQLKKTLEELKKAGG